MLDLKNKIFGDLGYSTDLKLNESELTVFRQEISSQWLVNIKNKYPSLYETAKKLGIENYHLISEQLDHANLWPKISRVLPVESVEIIKKLPFFITLQNEFGDFSISDVIDAEQRRGQEEIYWRLVRPNVRTDVGHLHKDAWYHNVANSGYGMFSKDVVTVKVWIPIYCEPGKNGLAIAAGSHKKEWKYHIEYEDGIGRPIPDEDMSDANAELISIAPGTALMFNDQILHGGVINQGEKTRISVEITMVLK